MTPTRPSSSRPAATRQSVFLALALLVIGTVHPTLQTRPADQAPAAADRRVFRHHPGGKALARRPGQSDGDALRADIEAQLTGGLRLAREASGRVRRDGTDVVRFGLEYDGVPLDDRSDVVAVVGANRRLLASGVRRLPLRVETTTPVVSAEDASVIALADARVRGGVTVPEGTAPILQVQVDDEGLGRLVWAMTVRATGDGGRPFAMRYAVSALEAGRILEAIDLVRDANLLVQAEMWRRSSQDPVEVRPLPLVQLFVDGLPTTANGAGIVTSPAPFPGPSSVQTAFRGPYARVQNAAGPTGLSATAVGSADEQTATLVPSGEFAQAQTTAYYWTTAANRWVRQHVPSLDAAPSALDGLTVRVNDALSCNAFSATGLISFGRSNASCTNFATPTVIAHEFGHEVHAALAGFVLDVSLTEGFADALSHLLLDEPCLGGGGVVGDPSSCLRNATDTALWPVASSDPHAIGAPFAQFVWQLRTALGTEPAAGLLFDSMVLAPADIPEAVYAMFVADDDDGLVGTCSPNQLTLQAAADSRNLPRPQDCRPAGDNRPPTASDDVVTLAEDASALEVDLLANDSDPDGDRLQIRTVQASALGTWSCTRTTCSFRPQVNANGTEVLSYTAIDTFGGEATATIRITVTPVEDPLIVGGPLPVVGDELTPIDVRAVAFDDDGPAITVRWFADNAGAPAPCAFADPTAVATTLTCTSDGVYAIGIVVTQGTTVVQSPTAEATIANVQPSVTIDAPVRGAIVSSGSSITLSASFTEGPTSGAHTCAVDWGDGAFTPGVVANLQCTGVHAYDASAVGPLTITVGVFDPSGALGLASVDVVVGAADPIDFTGFLPPIEMPTARRQHWNAARAGQVIPARWHLRSGGLPVSDPAVMTGVFSSRVSCVTGAADPLVVEEPAPGPEGIEWLGEGRWRFIWRTPRAYAGTCRTLVVRFADGSSSPRAYFRFR